jgi:hypothetical protein
MDAENKLLLPELCDATLDARTVRQLFQDYAACVAIQQVSAKSAAHGYASGHVSLQEGERLLQSGALRGLQVRYRYQNADWCDTLLSLPEGRVRLVRIQG